MWPCWLLYFTVLKNVYQIVLSVVGRSSTEVLSALPSSNFQRRRKASNPRKHVMKQSEESEGASWGCIVIFIYSCSLNLNHWIRQKTCHCKGTQTSMPEKCTDQAAVVEPTISSPDISLQIQSESSPESTSLNESSNPNTPYSTSWKVSLCFSLCYRKVSCCTRLYYVMNKKQQEVSHPVKFSWSTFVPHYCSLSFRLRILM